MDIRKLQRAIVDGLEDVKAQNITVFDTEHLSSMFERVIIASGTSNRQTKALASSVRDSVKSRGMQVLRTEGEENGEWIIVDCGAAVAHIMQPAIRDYYHLEEIWGGKAVRMKIAGPGGGLVKAAEPAPAPQPERAPVRKPAAKRAAASQAPARRAPAARAPAKQAVAKKAAPRKAPTRNSAAAGAAPARKTAAAAKPPAGKTTRRRG